MVLGVSGSVAYPAVAAGSFSAPATTWQSLGYPLVQGRGYVAWVVAVDKSGRANVQASATAVAFTAEDRLPPAFASFTATVATPAVGGVVGQPAVTGATAAGGFILRMVLAAPGRVYWVAVDGGAPATEPTRAEVTAGTAAGGAAGLEHGAVDVGAADTLIVVTVVGPAAGQTVSSASAGYSVFVATVSGTGGDDLSYSGDGSLPADVSATNAAKVAPGLVSVPDANAANSYSYLTTAAMVDAAGDGTECVGLATLTETSLTPRLSVSAAPARVAYVLLRHGSPTPSAAQVLAGVDAAGSQPLAAAGSDFPAAGVSASTAAGAADLAVAFTPTVVGGGAVNLTRGTTYDLYAVAALTTSGSTSGPDGPSHPYVSLPPRVVRRMVRTPDLTPPFFLPGFPKVAAAVPGKDWLLDPKPET